jgi:integrase
MMALKIPRLGRNRHGVFYIRVYFFAQNCQRSLAQFSLKTKDPKTARHLALEFSLALEKIPFMERKKFLFEEVVEKITNPLKITAADGESVDFDPSNPAEAAWAQKWKSDKDKQLQELRKQAQDQGRELTLLEAMGGQLNNAYAATTQQVQATIQHSDVFSVATAAYLNEKKLDNVPNTIAEKKRTYDDFVATHNDLEINLINKAVIVAWKTADLNRDLSANRINKRLSQMNDFFKWAINHGKYTASSTSPVEGLFISKKKATKATEKGEPFTDDDIKALFGTGYTERMFAPDHYWIPLICLFSGVRREDAGDLHSADVGNTDGVPTFFVRKGKTVKDRRHVPVHQMLIDLGFMEYAQARRDAGHEVLFPHRPKGAGGRSKEAGRMFTLRLREDCGITNKRKKFHSTRHTVTTRLHKISADPAHIFQITAHADGVQSVHYQTYTHGMGFKELQTTLNRLKYEHDFLTLKLEDPTFKKYFETEKLADEKKTARAQSKAKNLAAKAAREERNRDKRKKPATKPQDQ